MGVGDNHKKAHLANIRAPGLKGATGAQGAAERLHEKFQDVFFLDLVLGILTILDEYFVDPY